MSKIKKLNLNNEKKILIFFQSLAEISSIHQLLNTFPFGKVIIIVTGGKHFLSVLKRLKVEKLFGAKIFKFHLISLKNPLNLFFMYFRFYHSLDSKILKKYNFEKGFFFSEYEDFVTPIFLDLSNVKQITLIDNYQNIFSKKKSKINIKNSLRFFLIKLLLIGIDVKISHHRYKYFSIKSFFQFARYRLLNKKIIRCKPLKISLLPKFRLKFNNRILKKKNIIYIDANDEERIGDEFKVIMDKLFKLMIQNNYNVIIKRKPIPHKLSPSLKNKSEFRYIDDTAPIELFDLSKINFVFGFMSTGLSKLSEENSHLKVFSIVNLLSAKKKGEYGKMTKNFLKSLQSKKGKIYFPSSYNEILKNIK